MKRPIEFRAWDIHQKKYKYPKLWDNTMPSNWEQHYILEQYTGLTDRNGVKIWEGDLVSYHNPFSQKTYVHTVRWDERWAAFGMFEDGNDYCQESDWQKIVDVEVCGNIHESGGGEG